MNEEDLKKRKKQQQQQQQLNNEANERTDGRMNEKRNMSMWPWTRHAFPYTGIDVFYYIHSMLCHTIHILNVYLHANKCERQCELATAITTATTTTATTAMASSTATAQQRRATAIKMCNYIKTVIEHWITTVNTMFVLHTQCALLPLCRAHTNKQINSHTL